jgi:hypothetical protein
VFISAVDTNATGTNTIETNSVGAAAYSHGCRNHDCSCSNTHFNQHIQACRSCILQQILLLTYNYEAHCHWRISDSKQYVGTVAGRIGYRAI